jgi:peptidoglycan/LPS O-acetylase OafA/YrhL
VLSRYIRLGIPAAASCVLAYLSYIIIQHLNIDKLGYPVNVVFESDKPSLLNSLYYGLVRSIFYLRGEIKYNPVLWTMAIEFFGSIALYVSYKSKKPLLTMLFISVSFSFVNSTTFLGVFCFFVGMLIKEKILNYENKKLSFVLIFIGVYFSGVHNCSSSYNFLEFIFGKRLYIILNFLSGVFIVIGVVINNSIKNFLSKDMIVKFGSLSFPIYLTHWSYLCVFIILLRGLPNLFSAFIILLISMILSIPFKKIDDLAINISKKIRKK